MALSLVKTDKKPNGNIQMPEIVLGEGICEKIKNIYHANEPWPDCHQLIADKFSSLKVIVRPFYPTSELDMLKELSKYTENDIIDCFVDKVTDKECST
jgi:hypothetical protein